MSTTLYICPEDIIINIMIFQLFSTCCMLIDQTNWLITKLFSCVPHLRSGKMILRSVQIWLSLGSPGIRSHFKINLCMLSSGRFSTARFGACEDLYSDAMNVLKFKVICLFSSLICETLLTTDELCVTTEFFIYCYYSCYCSSLLRELNLQHKPKPRQHTHTFSLQLCHILEWH